MKNIELKEIVDLLKEVWIKKIMFNWKIIVDLENIKNLKIWDDLEYKGFNVDIENENQMAIFSFIKK